MSDEFDDGFTSQPPKVYRAMKRDPGDNLPIVGSTSSSELGVRPGVDITVDAAWNVVRDNSGDVRFTGLEGSRFHPNSEATPAHRAGSDRIKQHILLYVGDWPVSEGDRRGRAGVDPRPGARPWTHGVIGPVQVVPLAQYQTDLEVTRAAWQIDKA